MKTTRWTALLQNQVVALVLVMLFVVPALFAAPQAHRGDQLVVYGILGLVLMVAWALRAQGGFSLEKVKTFLTSGPNLPIILFVAWNAASTAMSTEPAYSRWSMIQLAFGVILYAVVVYQFRQREQVRALLGSVLLMGVAAVIAALALNGGKVSDRLAGYFRDQQLFGAFLMMILPVALGIAAGTRNKVFKIGAQLSVVLLLGALLMTGVRAAWLGTIVALVTFALLSLVFAWKMSTLKSNKHEVFLVPVLALVAVVLFVSFSGMGGHVQNRLNTLTSGSIQKDDSVKDRVEALWSTGKKVMAAAPVFGFGPATYPLVQARFNENSRPEAMIRQLGPSLFDNPHNLYIQLRSEIGLGGLALYAAILIAFLATGVRALGKMDNGLRKYVLIGCIAAVAGQSVDAIANPAYVFAEVTTFFWVVLAIGMCAAGIGQRIGEESSASVREGSRVATPNFLVRGLRTAVIGCAALWAGALLWSLHSATAAAAGAPPLPGGGPGGGGGGVPTYSGLLSEIDVDLLEDQIGPPAAFNVNNATIYCNRALEFHVFAIADQDDQSANVTFEKKAFKFKLEGGLKGKIFWTAANNNPRFFFKPAKAGCNRSGQIRVKYKTKAPKESFETLIGVTVLGEAPPNI